MAIKGRIKKNTKLNAPTAIFQYISIASFVVLLNTPKIVASLPALVVLSTAIISLVKKEPRKYISIAILVITAFLMMPSYETSPSSSASKSAEESYVSKMRIENNWKWELDGDYGYVRGTVTNAGDKPIRYFKITAHYVDKDNKVVDTDFTNSGETLMPNMSKKFEITTKYSKEYKNVNIFVEEVSLK